MFTQFNVKTQEETKLRFLEGVKLSGITIVLLALFLPFNFVFKNLYEVQVNRILGVSEKFHMMEHSIVYIRVNKSMKLPVAININFMVK